MKYVFKGVPKAVITTVLLFILYSLAITAGYWFFKHVLFSGEVYFLIVWKDTYLVMLAVWAILAVWTLIKRAAYGLVFASQFECSFDDALEAIMVHNLRGAEGHMEWSPEEFTSWLGTKRVASSFADAVVNAVFARRSSKYRHRGL